jgi:hypothetical protein
MSAFAQKVDSSKTKKMDLLMLKDSSSTDTSHTKGFLDVNGNGIDDRMEQMQKRMMQRHKKDFFRDEDGDGICDGKESSIGLQKLRKRRMRHRMR